MKILALVIAIFFTGCATNQPRNQTGGFEPDVGDSGLPTKLEFDLKNGPGDVLIVHYFFGKVFVSEQIGSQTTAYSFLPSPAEWAAFWQSMEAIQIWQWGSGVDCDEPTYWALELNHNAHDLSISGTHFERGMDGKLSHKKEGWLILSSAIETLIHHKSKLLEDSK